MSIITGTPRRINGLIGRTITRNCSGTRVLPRSIVSETGTGYMAQPALSMTCSCRRRCPRRPGKRYWPISPRLRLPPAYGLKMGNFMDLRAALRMKAAVKVPAVMCGITPMRFRFYFQNWSAVCGIWISDITRTLPERCLSGSSFRWAAGGTALTRAWTDRWAASIRFTGNGRSLGTIIG